MNKFNVSFTFPNTILAISIDVILQKPLGYMDTK